MKEIIIFNKTESILQCFANDLVTFSFLLLCIWFSADQGGGWWTFFTCSLFILALSGKVSLSQHRKIKLKSKQEAIDWANALPD